MIALDGFDIAIMGFIAPTLKHEWGNQLRARLRHQRGADWPGAGAILWAASRLAGAKENHRQQRLFFGFWTIVTAFSQNIEQMIFSVL